MLELYQDTLVDLLLPKNAKRLKLDIKKDSKVIHFLNAKYFNFRSLRFTLVKIVDLNSFNFMELVSQAVYFTLVVLGNGNGRKCNNCANFYYGGIE
jgi:hypothetical protein